MSTETQPTRMVPEAWLESLTAELVGARAAFLLEQTRANNAQGWADAYKAMLAEVLAIFPDGWKPHEDQLTLMRAHDLVSGGETQFRKRGSK